MTACLTPSAIVGTLYLALVISAGAYLVWNWALARVEASRAAPFLTIQPVVGALLRLRRKKPAA